MDKLNELIRQARPLYKQRKRRKTIAMLLFSFTLPAIIIANVASLYVQGDNIYVSMDKNQIQNELMDYESGILGL